jgi:pimeloyl-ACP methyl ester carboxylesterase
VNAFTTSDCLRIAYRRSGTGPALVLLHGFAADGRVWRTQIDDFSRDFDVIAWDAQGCGQSNDTPEDFSMEDSARCLLALLDAAGVEAPHLWLPPLGAVRRITTRFTPTSRMATRAICWSIPSAHTRAQI